MNRCKLIAICRNNILKTQILQTHLLALVKILWGVVDATGILAQWVTFTPFLPPYLQVWHPFLKGLWVVSQSPLLLQELGISSISGRLEEAVVVHVPQRFAEGADDLLLGVPHCTVRVKLETPLRSTQREHRAAWRSEVSEVEMC